MYEYLFMYECMYVHSNLILAFIHQREGRITTKAFKSMGLERIHSRQLKDLADAPVGLLTPVVMKRGHRGLEKDPYYAHL